MAARKPATGVFGAILRLFFPVLFLIGAYGLAYVAGDYAITLFDDQALLGQEGLAPSRWLTLGHLAILLPVFVVMMTNRIYGPPYALAQIVASWLILAGVVSFGWADLAFYMSGLGPQPALDGALPFLGALGLAHVVSILVFDTMRGRPWWRAPLFGGLAGAVVLPLVSWGLSHAPGAPWISGLTLDLALKVATAFTLLLPYALLRPIAKPRDGFGGY